MRAGDRPTAPSIAVGVVVTRDDSVLLVKRGKPPARDQWAVPGGSVELGESLEAAAEREVLEETGIDVRAGAVVHAFDAIERDDVGGVRFHYVVIDLLGHYLAGEPRAGDDALAARWVRVDELDRLEVSDETRRLVERLSK